MYLNLVICLTSILFCDIIVYMKKENKKEVDISGYDIGRLVSTIQKVSDKNGRVEYVMESTLYIKNNTDVIYDYKDEVMDTKEMSEEAIEKERYEKINFRVSLIDENTTFKNMIVDLMENALRLKIKSRIK